ncbi:MAG: hypothetical protein MZW92_16965 [Comamonadaceae bacterium]|nr:hypothetical protein [Comamonadaceae bacterium]
MLHRAQKIFGYLPAGSPAFRRHASSRCPTRQGLRRGHLLQLLPHRAHRRPHRQRLPGHGLPRQGRLGDHQGDLEKELGKSRSAAPRTTASTPCRRRAASAPAAWPRCMMVDDEVHGRLNPQKSSTDPAGICGPRRSSQGTNNTKEASMKLEDLRKIREKSEKDMVLRDGKARLQGGGGHGHERHRRRRPRNPQGLAGRGRKARAEGHHRHPGRRAGPRAPTSRWSPVIEEGKPTVVYGNVSIEVARKIVAEHLVNGNPVSDSIIEVKG